MWEDRGHIEVGRSVVSFIENKIRLNSSLALDVGCGQGQVSLAIAEKSGEVFSLDISEDSMKILKDRVGDLGVRNVLISFGSALFLPYRDNLFDLVVMNGVLEWIPLGTRKDPRETQLEALREIRRVLKEGGLFYLGIENRFYLKYWLGWRDHSGLRFASILPRKIANWYSKAVKGEEYRHYIYSLTGYKKLLTEAGFKKIEFYTALPNYKFPMYIIEIDNKKEIKNKIKKVQGNKLLKAGGYLLASSRYLYKKLGPDYVILSEA